jgi:hypothetical protein
VSDSNKGNDKEGGRQAMATRVTAMQMATMWAMAMAARLAGDNKGKGKGSKGNDDGNEVTGKEEGEGGRVMATATRVAGEQTTMATKRAMGTKTREASKEEGNGKGGKSNGDGKEDGNGKQL